MHGLRPSYRAGSSLGEHDVPYETRSHHLGHGTNGLLDRHCGVDAAQAVDIHVVRPETAQRVGEESLDGRGTPVNTKHVTLCIAQRSAFHADDRTRAIASPERV